MKQESMRILIVEDDGNERDRIEECLRRELRSWKLDFVRKDTESQFRRDFAPGGCSAGDDTIDVAVLDLMLIWERTTPEPTDQPEEVTDGGVEKAGIRCLEILRSNPATANVPCVIYSHLNPDTLPQGVVFIPKGSDASPLAKAIMDAVRRK